MDENQWNFYFIQQYLAKKFPWTDFISEGSISQNIWQNYNEN